VSKIGTALALPILLLGLKRFQESVKDDPNPKNILPTLPDTPKTVDDTQVRPRERFGL
tara:strand:+ start:1171 stop:1344 length:174 start_codon:yes stop_codon:yes gene_type:complete